MLNSLGSPSPTNGHSSPRRTPIQGLEDVCTSSESTPRSTGGALNIFTEGTAVSHTSLIAASRIRSKCAEPNSPPKPRSPLRMTTVLGGSSTSDVEDNESLSSPTSRYTLTALWKQNATMSLTGDKMTRDTSEVSQQRPGAWYMRRDKTKMEQQTDAPVSSTTDLTPTKLPSLSAMAPPPTPASSASKSKVMSPALGSRFPFFNMAALKGIGASTVLVPKDDALANLDINTALFPNGAPKEGEPFSPAAFKNLQMNATGLLRRFQSAYQDKAIACQELRAERDAQQDEKIEMETRTAHLKMQLEGMAQKVAEKEGSMQALIEELSQEKKLRTEERMARESGVMSSGMSTISEDLGAEDDQRKRYHRQSAGTTKSDDAGFDTDEESVDEVSVFSRSRSPALAASAMDGAIAHGGYTTPPLPQVTKSTLLGPPRSSRQSQPQQISTFQKLFKGISGEAATSESTQGCQNCQGQDASVAWDTVGLLRDENRGLKQRVGDLETAVEEALDAVLGVKL